MPQDPLNAAVMYQPFKVVGKPPKDELQAIPMSPNPSWPLDTVRIPRVND